jgi:hypothetical protein
MLMLRRTALAFALLLASAATSAGSRLDACDAESDYSLKIDANAITWSRAAGTPASVVMSRGRLTVDGREVELVADDRERITEYEATVRELVPEIRAIAFEAVAIAFTAVTEVARTFSGDESEFAASQKRFATLESEARAKIEQAFTRDTWSNAEFEQFVQETVETMVPELVGNMVGKAVRIALSGDTQAAAELEERAERMEKTIEDQVEARAEALERRAESLCPIIADLDQIESGLALRLADGSALDLVQVD